MKKFLTLTAGLLAAAVSLSAADEPKMPGVICLKDGREVKAASIEITKKKDIRYTEAGAKVGKSFKSDEVKWIWVQKPSKIKKADADAATTPEAYLKLAQDYKAYSWEPYCTVKAAKLMMTSGKKDEAAKLLESLYDYKNTNPKNEGDLMDAYEMLVNYYIEAKNYDKAISAAEKLINSPDDNVACNAVFARGNALKAKAAANGDKELMKSAALCYFQAALLFPKSKRNAEALYASYQAMQDAKDARAQKFADLLKKNHPDSPQAALVK